MKLYSHLILDDQVADYFEKESCVCFVGHSVPRHLTFSASLLFDQNTHLIISLSLCLSPNLFPGTDGRTEGHTHTHTEVHIEVVPT
jgi:hypothetical protein